MTKSEQAGSQEGGPAIGKPAETEGRTSVSRTLGLLDLFTSAVPSRPVADLVNYLGTSRSTAYRSIKALHEAGLLEAVADGHYVLGPRIVEMDRQIRESDPLYRSGGGVLQELALQTGHSALLCALYRDNVMCIRDHMVPGSPQVLFSRGQRRPLFAGAASKVILPYVATHRLRSIYNTHSRAIAVAGLGTNWEDFRATLALMRKEGFVMSRGEFNPGVFGIAAPVFNQAGLVVGSVGIAGLEQGLSQDGLTAHCVSVVLAGQVISESLTDSGGPQVRPPRAFGSPTGRDY